MPSYVDVDDDEVLSGTMTKQPKEFHSSMKKKNKQITNQKKNNSPIKLDKNLKTIENRILQKMKNKRDNSFVQTKLQSIERNNSPSVSSGNLKFKSC